MTFVQMGIFIYIQQLIAGTSRGSVDFSWEGIVLHVFFLLT